MKTKTFATIIFFLLFALFLPGDGHSKGGGIGKGFSRGGKFSGSFRSGHVGKSLSYPAYSGRYPHSGSYYGGGGTGFYLGAYLGASSLFYAPTGCYSCHPGLSWVDRFRNCTYPGISRAEIAEDKILTDKDIQTWRNWRDRDPYVGP